MAARLVVGAAVVLGTAAAALAASAERAPSPLDRHVVQRAAVAPAPARPLESLAAGDSRRAAWDAFRTRYGGSWDVYLDERSGLPALVSGEGLPWLADAAADAATLDGLAALARRFLADNAPALGDWSDVLELDRAASGLLGDGHWQIVFRQSVDGVRVDDARLELHVVRGRLVLFGAAAWVRPRARGVPRLAPEYADELARAHVGPDAPALRAASPPELRLVPVGAGPGGAGLDHLLVWRLAYDEAGAPRRWIAEVDAQDGTLRAFYEGTQYGSVRGGVFPAANDGDCAHGGCEVAGFPLPFADYTEAGQPERFADSYANMTCADGAAAATTNLSGPYVRIVDTCGATAETGACGGGIDLGTKAGENCAVAPGRSAGDTAAARTAYYHVNRVAEIARFYAPSNTWLNAPLTVNVNVNGTCNANWTGSVINMYGAGGGCNNLGENTDILVHEWGHGYDQNDGGGIDKPSEAYSDIIAILATRDSCQGRGTLVGSTCTGYGDACLTCTGFRDFDWDARQAHTPATPTGFVATRCSADSSQYAGPCRREPHCESYVASEAMYDLAARDLPAAGMDRDTAWQLVDRLWFQTRAGSGGNAYTCALPTSDSCAASSWYQRMRTADDDDGNLANGTPHAAELFAAFSRHKIACGAANDKTNKNTSSCPALAAPVVTRTVTPAGVQLSWPAVTNAAEYRVYRGDLGCERQQVPLAVVTAPQTSYADTSGDGGPLRAYRVQAHGSVRSCAGPVSACVMAPPGSVLEHAGERVIDDGDGVPEPGETLDLAVALRNSGADPALAATGRVRLLAPPDARILDPEASWPAIPQGATVETSAPHFRVVLQDTARCGDVLTLALSGSAENAPPFADEIRVPMGTRTHDFPETSIIPIPYLTTTPVTATWNVTEDRIVDEVDVTLDIFHQTPTQIIVELVSPRGTRVRLHDRGQGSGHGIETRFDRDTPPSGPGTMADFAGEPMLGTWTLSVQDVDGSGITTDGYIRPRTLHLSPVGAYGCDPQTCAEPKPAAAPDLRVARVVNGPRLDLVLTWTAVAGAGYHVLQSAEPAFRSVDLVGTTVTETSFTIPDGVRTTPALNFFQVRAVNACHQEGP